MYHNAIALSVCKRSFICIYLSNRSCYSSPGRLVNIRMFVAFKAFALSANKENLSSDLPCTHVFTIFLPMSLHSSITCTVYGLIVPIYISSSTVKRKDFHFLVFVSSVFLRFVAYFCGIQLLNRISTESEQNVQ